MALNFKDMSNIDELERHLKQKFNGMLSSPELRKAGEKASKEIGMRVLSQATFGGEGGTNLTQTGDLMQLLAEEARGGEVVGTARTLTIGMGELNNLNMGLGAQRLEQTQEHYIGSGKGGRVQFKTFKLKEETQMPKWIIAEFGSGSKADMDFFDYPQFKVGYTKRPERQYMFGMSTENIKPDGSKKGTFMVGTSTIKRYSKARIGHSGVRPSKIFRRGVEDSKPMVEKILGDGIEAYFS